MNVSRYEHAVHSIYEAAHILCDASDSIIEFQTKSSHQDIVSYFDKKIEAFLSEQILKQFPEDGIVGEELDHAHIGQWVWYIDPIDGTSNFMNQQKNYAISIGCCHNGVPVFGLVLDVAAGRLYHAQKGGGAYCNGERLSNGRLHKNISEMFLYTPILQSVFLSEHPNRDNMMRLANDVRAVRSLGSVALELCALATHEADLFVTARSSPWDHNAARLILSEAGGAMCTWEGESVPMDQTCAIIGATCPALLSEVMSNYFYIKEA